MPQISFAKMFNVNTQNNAPENHTPEHDTTPNTANAGASSTTQEPDIIDNDTIVPNADDDGALETIHGTIHGTIHETANETTNTYNSTTSHEHDNTPSTPEINEVKNMSNSTGRIHSCGFQPQIIAVHNYN
jgi:hypothetical protein